MKILFAATSEKLENGAAKCLIELSQELKKSGYEIYISVPNYGSMYEELNRIGMKCIVFRERHSWAIKGGRTLFIWLKELSNVHSILLLNKL